MHKTFLAHGLIVSFCGALGLSQAAEAPRPLKALLITGGCCHDYTAQKDFLAAGISARANVDWTIVQDPSTGTTGRPSIYSKENWAAGFDVVVHNECFADEKDLAWVEHIIQQHRQGVAAVMIHCAMHCYRAPTNEWFKLVGVTSHRHGSHFAYPLKNVKPGHPVMKGFPAVWQTPKEELYHIAEMWPNAVSLGTGFSPETKKDETCVWVNTYSSTRVFGTTVGHYNETMRDPVYLDLVTRGLLWACGKLEDNGEPVAGFGPQARATTTQLDWAAAQRFPATEIPVRLFNGTDFNGWEGHIDPYWAVKDRIIVAKNSAQNAPKVSTYLTTKKNYRNFRLLLEGKLVTSEMHSGISLWGKTVEKEGESKSYTGHLVMFPSGWGFWDLYRRNGIYQDDGRAKAAGRQHDWNQMEILAIGDRIRFAVNGKLVADWRDPKPELCQSGPLGLQLHSNKEAQEIQFRGLVLSENPEDRMITTSE